MFGPTAWATPANAVTVARLLIAPMLFGSISDGPAWWLFFAWFVLCASDGVDGWLARRMGTTRSGAFLDPMADKVLVLGALFALVAYGAFSWIPVVLIAARELLISLYRSVAARQGISVPASRLAKWKTFTQQFAVGLVLLPPVGNNSQWPGVVCLWVAVALTLVTGAQYLITARQRAEGARVLG